MGTGVSRLLNFPAPTVGKPSHLNVTQQYTTDTEVRVPQGVRRIHVTLIECIVSHARPRAAGMGFIISGVFPPYQSNEIDVAETVPMGVRYSGFPRSAGNH